MHFRGFTKLSLENFPHIHLVFFKPTTCEDGKMEIVVKILFLIIVVINFSDGHSYQRLSHPTEICGYHNGHRKYLELGESGKLTATNITVPNVSEFIDFKAA